MKGRGSGTGRLGGGGVVGEGGMRDDPNNIIY